MGRGDSIEGGILWPLPKHHGHEMGGLRVDSPPWGWGLVCLHLVHTDSKSQPPFPKLVLQLWNFYPLVFGHVR